MGKHESKKTEKLLRIVLEGVNVIVGAIAVGVP
jgi:hypothetical protein